MGKFTNLEFFAEPKTTLSTQEINVLQAVVDNVLTSFEKYPTKGTFILDGQAKGQDAECILRFDLAEGDYRICGYTSRDIAADSIDNALSWPEESRYQPKGRALHFSWLPGGIYRDEELVVLILNTTHGRFLASFCAEFDSQPEGYEEAVLVAIATAMAHMCKEDKTLQYSAGCIKEQATDFERYAILIMDAMFESCMLPSLGVWKKWHESANNSGELTLFFE